jgi:hypothetical protein
MEYILQLLSLTLAAMGFGFCIGILYGAYLCRRMNE